jgi:hypothetical protein
MFEEGFSRIRNFIIDHSATIVQDDAGIPLADFNRGKWNIRVFGTYIGPIEIFKQHYQPKLKEIFEQSGPPPIEFNFGYRWNYKGEPRHRGDAQLNYSWNRRNQE